MNRRVVLGVLLALVLIAGAVSLGAYAYNIGVTQGLAQSGRLGDVPPETGIGPYPYFGGPFWYHRPFGFGFFGCFGPLLFILLLFVLFRGLWWGGWRGYGPGGGHRHWDKAVPPMFEEWHSRAHDQEREQAPPSSAG